MLCPCLELTYSDFDAFRSEHPEITFEDVLAATGAGSKCTACLLDVEHHYSAAATAAAKPASFKAKKNDAQRPLKRRIYDFLDRVSPLVDRPREESYWIPLFHGPTVSTDIVVSNQFMVFGNEHCAPDMDVDIDVFGRDGKQLASLTQRVAQGDVFRCTASGHLGDYLDSSPVPGVALGTARVFRRARKPGFKGTTRPQVEIVGRAGASTVHGTAPGLGRSASRGGITTVCRPNDERQFLSVVNPSKQPIEMEVQLPVCNLCKPRIETVSIPARGISLIPIALNDEETRAIGTSAFFVSWNGPRSRMAHYVASDAGFERVSIDHV